MAADFTESFPHGGPGSNEGGGQGFDAASPASPTRRGITRMRERFGLLGGRLEIDSEPAAGTGMRLEAPLANARS
jgi:signal transduction histidine kinase